MTLSDSAAERAAYLMRWTDGDAACLWAALVIERVRGELWEVFNFENRPTWHQEPQFSQLEKLYHYVNSLLDAQDAKKRPRRGGVRRGQV